MPKKSKYIKGITLVVAVIALLSLSSNLFAAKYANHIILIIGDGMQMEHEIATSRYLYNKDTKLFFHNFPIKTNVTTWDVTTYEAWGGSGSYDPADINPVLGYDPLTGGLLPSPMQTEGLDDVYLMEAYTDSASAATTWATGHKTDGGNISWLPGDPPEGALPTIGEILRDNKDWAFGVVSTVPFSHATPAAHASHNTTRGDTHGIAREMLTDVKPDVVIGGGHPNYYVRYGELSDRYCPRDLYEEFVNGDYEDEYVFVERQGGVDGADSLAAAAQQAVAEGKKLFGLFGGSGGNFESPVPSDTPGSPSVDRATIENPLLKDAIVAALEVLSQDPDGFYALIEQGDIDWANHANDYARMIGTTWDLHVAVEAAVEFINRPGDDIDWGNTLMIVTSDHGNSYMRLTNDPKLKKGDLPTQDGTSYPDGEVTYSTTNHTNELVRLYAKGKKAQLFHHMEGEWYPCTRTIDNTQIFDAMMIAAGYPMSSPLNVIPDESTCAK